MNLTAEQSGNDVPYNETTCGRDAYRRGTGQKIVGFSFYGDVNSTVSIEKGYFDGIVGNLKLMPKFYPGYFSLYLSFNHFLISQLHILGLRIAVL